MLTMTSTANRTAAHMGGVVVSGWLGAERAFVRGSFGTMFTAASCKSHADSTTSITRTSNKDRISRAHVVR